MATHSRLQKAIEIVTQATNEDHKKNYQEALRLYEVGVEHFQCAVKYEVRSDKQMQLIGEKCVLYLNRAEKLKEYLKNNDGKVKKPIKNKDSDSNEDLEKKKFQDKLSGRFRFSFVDQMATGR